MESRYKRPHTQTSVKSRIKIREQKSQLRRSERHEALMQRRNIVHVDESLLSPSVKQQAIVPNDLQSKPKRPAKKTSQERKAQLQKYKENKLMQKKIEKEMSKPVFKISAHVKFDNPFSSSNQQLKPKNTASDVEKRVTRSMTKPAAANKVLSDKAHLRHTSLITSKTKMCKDTPVFLAPTSGAPKPAKIVKKTERKSFAPDNFVFNPPACWRTPVVKVTRLEELTKTEGFLDAFLLNPQLSRANTNNSEILSSHDVKENENIPMVLCDPGRNWCPHTDLNDTSITKKSEETKKALSVKHLGQVTSESAKCPRPLVFPDSSHNHNLCQPSTSSQLSKLEVERKFLLVSANSSQLPGEMVPTTAETVGICVKDAECGSKSSSKDADTKTPEGFQKSLACAKCDLVMCGCNKDASQFTIEPAYCSPMSVNGSGSAVKRHRTRFAVGLECSPWITKFRGSSSQKKRQSLCKTAVMTSTDIPSYPSCSFDDGNEEEQAKVSSAESCSIASPELSTEYFEELVSKQKEKFNQSISLWNDIEKCTTDIPEKALGQIHCVVGLARLLMDQRLKQFEELILDCKLKRGEKKTTCEDLLGFWEMVTLQVDDINTKFNELEVLKSRSWQEPESTKSVQRKKTVIKKPVVKKAVTSNFRKFLSEARKGKSNKEAAEIIVPLTPSRRRSVTFSADKCTQTPTRQKHKDVIKTENEKLSPAVNLLGAGCSGTQGNVPARLRRKSVRFTVHEDCHPNEESKYRTTPFSTRRVSKLVDKVNASSSGSLAISLEDNEANIEDKEAHFATKLTELKSPPKVSKREPSLLPMPVVEVQKLTTADGNLMQFSPLRRIENTFDFASR